jgi:hypothetical protein
MPNSNEPVWRSDIDSLAFHPSGHSGFCVVHRRAFGTLLGSAASPQQSIDFYRLHRDAFDAAAHSKLEARAIAASENFHITSRDVRRQLKNPVASGDDVG